MGVWIALTRDALPLRPSGVTANVTDCNLKQAAHGLCDTHYRRQKRYGTTDLPQKPPVKPMPPFKCRLCGVDLPKTEKGRLGYCSKECREGFQYWERKRTHRERWLKHRFGLTVEQYEAMVEVQGGKCAICFTTEPSSHKGRHWCIDHDHKTGKVRGLLCANCNSGLGQLKDDPDVLRRAIEYLG